MKLRLATIMAAVAAIGLASFTAVPPAYSADPDVITLSGAGPQGRWFKESSLFGKVLTEALGGNPTVNGVIGKGVSVGNIKRIAAGRVEGGRFYQFDIENAHKGLNQFKGGDYGNVLVWMKLGTHLFRVVADINIKKFSNLKGKKVAIGVKGSGDDLLAIRILKNYGITTDNTPFQFIGRSDAQNALANHQLDAIAMPYARNNRGHLGPVFAARPVGKSTDFAIPDADKNEAFLAADKTFFLDKLGEPAFGRPDLVGIAFYQGMAIRADLSDDLVYRMTKALYENWGKVLKGAPWWDAPGEASLESAPAFTTVPYHPGAVRYYKEKGVWSKYHK